MPVRLAPRPVVLAAREELLAGLAARLEGGGGRSGPRVVALCGLGGAGKTSVAIEYAHRQLAAGLGLVWQFAAEDATTQAAQFGELATLLGARDVVAGGDAVAAVHAVLAARPGGWLLIFDNATDMSSVAKVLPPGGDGQVLITSQSPYWPAGQDLDVPVLSTEVAAEFLLARTASRDGQSARALAAELGGLPLALEQAAAYTLATGQDLATYLTLYQQRQADMLARGQVAGYDKRVTTTWALAFTQLQERAPAAAGLLRLLACCAAEAIPYRLLLQSVSGRPELPAEEAAVLAPLLTDPLAADDAIVALRGYSLTSPPADGMVSVHRLVQALTRAQLTDADAATWQQAAAALITAALPADPQLSANWPAYALLLPHARATLPLTSVPLYQVAQYLGYSGSYTAARDLLHQILDADQRELGAEHPATLTARGNVAYWTGVAGDAAAARDQYAALLPLRERVSGAEHPATLTARANVAYWTGDAGDAAAARDQYAALLPIREQVLGAKHPETLNARANLARWTGAAGDAAAARDQYAALLPTRERVSGAEHPATLTDRSNLAYWTGMRGMRRQPATSMPRCCPSSNGCLAPSTPIP